MLKKVVLSALLVVTASSAAWAQSPRVEVTGLFGWSLSDGVTTEPYLAGNGKVYDAIEPVDSATFGASIGFFLTPSAEIGFLWRRQATELVVSGASSEDTLGDLNIDGYHGYAAYYFGNPDNKLLPYVMGGAGITYYGNFSFKGAGGQIKEGGGESQFSTIWGAGLKINASPNFGLKLGMQWTPTYIKSDATGMWCDPWYGCYVTGDAQYASQLEFVGGLSIRF
jgi:opacity protein-like surface antigen